MNTNKSILTIVLVIIGGWLALKLVGVPLGHLIGNLFGFLFPFILVGLGYLGIKNGNRLIGGILFGIGALILVGKLLHLLFPVLIIVLIVGGLYMLVSRNRRTY